MGSDLGKESVSDNQVLTISIAIDEEINSMMKIFEADQKRLKSILLTYEEKKPDMGEREKQERSQIVQWLKECFLLFKIAYNE